MTKEICSHSSRQEDGIGTDYCTMHPPHTHNQNTLQTNSQKRIADSIAKLAQQDNITRFSEAGQEVFQAQSHKV